MLNENAIKIFFEKIGEDKDFAAKVSQAVEPDQVIVIAGEEGIVLTPEDIMASKDILIELFEKQNHGELSEDDLEKVAGGVVVIAASVSAILICAGIGAVATLAGAAIGGAGTILGGVISAKGWKW